MFVKCWVFEHYRVPQSNVDTSLDSTLTELPAWIYCNFSIIKKEWECHNPLRENEKFKDGDRCGTKRMQEGGQADSWEKEQGDQKVWTIASLWPVKITPWRLQGQWGQSREGSQVFQSSEGNSSCLTKSLHPHWPNLYALSSLLLSVFFIFVKASHYVVSDLADLGRHAYLYIQFPV